MEVLSPRAQAKRQQITDAARALFLAQGYARTSMDAITAEAGVSKQTLYAYFDSKDDLLKAIVSEVQDALPEPPAPHAPRTRSELRAALIGFGEALIGGLLREETIALLRLMVGEAVHLPDFREAFLQGFPLFLLGRTRSILEAAAANGVIVLDRPDVSVRMLVGPLVSYVMFGGLLLSGRPQPPERDDIEWLVDAYLRTLTAVPGAAEAAT